MLTARRHPDRTLGVFETLLVVDGEPVELEAHLKRLRQSTAVLCSRDLPADVVERAYLAAGWIDLGKLRITAFPAEGDLQTTMAAAEIDAEIVFPAPGVKLRTRALPGGLGSHKWADRRGIDRPLPGEAGALIADEGEVLEAGWANVFAVRGGTLFTPPLDGRILPGTTRAALLDLAAENGIETCERPLSPEDLLAADEVFLSGSIRGVEAALELDGEPLAGRGPLSRRLADALRRRWGLKSDSNALQASASARIPGQLSR